MDKKDETKDEIKDADITIDLDSVFESINKEQSPSMDLLPDPIKKIVAKYVLQPVSERKKLKEKYDVLIGKYGEISDEDIVLLKEIKEKKEKNVKDDKQFQEILIKTKATYESEINKLKEIIKENLIDTAIIKAAQRAEEPSVIAEIFKNKFDVIERDGKFFPVYKEMEYDELGNPLTVEKVITKFLDDRSYLCKPSNSKGTGIQLNKNNGAKGIAPAIEKEIKNMNDVAGAMAAIRIQNEKKVR